MIGTVTGPSHSNASVTPVVRFSTRHNHSRNLGLPRTPTTTEERYLSLMGSTARRRVGADSALTREIPSDISPATAL